MTIIYKLYNLLTPSEQKRAILLLAMVLIGAFLDVLGVASILPFIGVLSNPTLVDSNWLLNSIYIYLNFSSTNDFLFTLGGLFFVLLVGSLIFKALVTYAQLRFSMMREFTIGKRLVEGYLSQPYEWFLGRHSADLSKKILSEVSVVTQNAILPLITLIAQSVIVLALLMLLTVVHPFLAITVFAVLGFSYGLVFIVINQFTVQIGNKRLEANHLRFASVNEAFGAIKELKFGSLEKIYIQRFSGPAYANARYQASAQIISQLPRFALEGIAFGGILLVMLYLMSQNNNFDEVLPIIALYAFTGYRLMPALQQIYSSLTQLRYASPAVDILHQDLIDLRPSIFQTNFPTNTLLLNNQIKLNNIVYSYPDSSKFALGGVTISIPAKGMVGFVGISGSGKSTLVDTILGLLRPQEGSLEVDNVVITDSNLRAWQRCIGYVPQQIYLIDDSVAANIALGVQDIDTKLVMRAAKIANLHDFIIKDLVDGYSTQVGERGVRLSGGQRQRIGIARALYHNPRILILDEATSALDNLTEYAVMNALRKLSQEITIIQVAHRLSTIVNCERIFLFESGQIIDHGTFKELIGKNEIFREMATNNV